MGFGLLFIGYFITYIMALNSVGFAFRLVGYAVMALALGKLSAYNKSFRPAQVGALVLVLFSVFDTATEIIAYLAENLILSSNPFTATALTVILDFEGIFVLMFHLLMLIAIRNIAKETDVHKIEVNVIRDVCFITLYYILSIIKYLPFPFRESYVRNMGLPLVLLYLAWIILDLTLIFECYANICDEGDVEMQRKPSRFAFVNKFRNELEAKQSRAREETAQYKRERAERRMNKKKNKK